MSARGGCPSRMAALLCCLLAAVAAAGAGGQAGERQPRRRQEAAGNLRHLAEDPAAAPTTEAAAEAECISQKPPAWPGNSPGRTDIKLTFFIAARNDEYGGYPAAVRSANTVASVLYGLQQHGLYGDAEILVVDWNSQVPLRCNPRYRRLLPNVPFHCTGAYNDRTCSSDVLRIIEVPPDMANRYAPNSSVSEVHTFNMAVTRARGKIVLRIDQDTFVRGPFFRWLHWQKKVGWPDLGAVWWVPRTGGIRKTEVPLVQNDMASHATDLIVCPWWQSAYAREPFRESDSVIWSTCMNGAVGVYGYPVDLMKDVRGMNERYIFWGGMEAELCSRAKLSKLFSRWIDVWPEMCGAWGFAHQEHDYTTGKRPGQGGNTSFDNGEHWGLQNETSLLHWVF